MIFYRDTYRKHLIRVKSTPCRFLYSAKQHQVKSNLSMALCEKCSNTEFFLVRIFLYSDWIWENTDQEELYIWTLFTKCETLPPQSQPKSTVFSKNTEYFIYFDLSVKNVQIRSSLSRFNINFLTAQCWYSVRLICKLLQEKGWSSRMINVKNNVNMHKM